MVPISFIQPAAPASPWSPRSPFSTAEPEIQDVSMEDASPFKIDLSSITLDDKLVATGNLTRDVQSPHKPNKTRKHRRSSPSDAEDEDDDENEEDDEVGALTTIPRRRRPFQKSLSEPLTTTNHNHHYTFTVPTPQLAHSEIPYLLLGCVFLLFRSFIAIKYSTVTYNSFLISHWSSGYFILHLGSFATFKKMWNIRCWNIN